MNKVNKKIKVKDKDKKIKVKVNKKINIDIDESKINNLNKNNLKFDIKRNKNEIDLYYDIRKFFIFKNNPVTQSKFLLIQMYSNILINIIFLKCRYEKKTEKLIVEFIKKYKNDLIIYIKNFNDNFS